VLPAAVCAGEVAGGDVAHAFAAGEVGEGGLRHWGRIEGGGDGGVDDGGVSRVGHGEVGDLDALAGEGVEVVVDGAGGSVVGPGGAAFTRSGDRSPGLVAGRFAVGVMVVEFVFFVNVGDHIQVGVGG